jgi:hypothetical protein
MAERSNLHDVTIHSEHTKRHVKETYHSSQMKGLLLHSIEEFVMDSR